MPHSIRRVVTTHNDVGESTILLDEVVSHPRANVVVPPHDPGVCLIDLWKIDSAKASFTGEEDTVTQKPTLQPPSRGMVIRTVEIPPEHKRNHEAIRGYFKQMGAEKYLDDDKAPRHPAMHKTESVDVIFVLSGSIWLILDDQETQLNQGDVVVQCGTNHAWSNRTEEPCILGAVLVSNDLN